MIFLQSLRTRKQANHSIPARRQPHERLYVDAHARRVTFIRSLVRWSVRVLERNEQNGQIVRPWSIAVDKSLISQLQAKTNLLHPVNICHCGLIIASPSPKHRHIYPALAPERRLRSRPFEPECPWISRSRAFAITKTSNRFSSDWREISARGCSRSRYSSRSGLANRPNMRSDRPHCCRLSRFCAPQARLFYPRFSQLMFHSDPRPQQDRLRAQSRHGAAELLDFSE